MREKELSGLLLAFTAMLLFNISDGAWKYALASMPLSTVVAISSAFSVLGLWRLARVQKIALFQANKKHTAIFAGLYLMAMTTFGMALQLMPMAQLFVIILTIPVVVLGVSHFLFHEKLSNAQIAAIVIGFLGALVAVLGPVFLEGSMAQKTSVFGVILALVHVCVQVAKNLYVRHRCQGENSTVISFWAYALMTGVYAFPALSGLAQATLWPVIALAVTAIAAALGTIFYVCAFQSTRAGLVAGTQYSQMIWAALIGTLIFHEPLTFTVLVGGGLILLSGLLLVVATLRAKKPEQTALS